MIYKCKWCKCEIKELETDGEGVCSDFICPSCAKRDLDDLAKTIHAPLHRYPAPSPIKKEENAEKCKR